MSIAVVTGSAGLIGSETSKRFHAEGLEIVGVDNDMRAKFFGAEASTGAYQRNRPVAGGFDRSATQVYTKTTCA